jgi:hypothetical protein
MIGSARDPAGVADLVLDGRRAQHHLVQYDGQAVADIRLREPLETAWRHPGRERKFVSQRPISPCWACASRRSRPVITGVRVTRYQPCSWPPRGIRE